MCGHVSSFVYIFADINVGLWLFVYNYTNGIRYNLYKLFVIIMQALTMHNWAVLALTTHHTISSNEMLFVFCGFTFGVL